MSQVIRTPEDRFKDLPDFPYKPHYNAYHGLRTAYIDETGPILDRQGKVVLNPNGPVVDEVFLCIHGEPTWSFLFRRMIPVILNERFASENAPFYVRRRVVAPDLIGFGRSDKPTDPQYYTFTMHRNYLLWFVEEHSLNNITLVVQDWGGILGLTIPQEFPNRFSRFLIMNTALGLGVGTSEGFNQWRNFAASNPDLPVGMVLARSTEHLSEKEIAAYDAPFPDKTYKVGAHIFPSLVPTDPKMDGVEVSKKALNWFIGLKPDLHKVFVCVGVKDPVIGLATMEGLSRVLFSSVGYWYFLLPNAGHFVQEFEGVDNISLTRRALQCFEGTKPDDVEWKPPQKSKV